MAETAAPHPLVWVGFLAFFFVALAVGVRLLLLARRTRQLPELCMGIGVLGIGPVGFGLMVLAQELRAGSPALYAPIVAAGMAAVAAGVIAKLIFNWRVYHPTRSRVAALVALAAAVHVAAFGYTAVVGFETFNRLDSSYLLRTALQIGALLWGSVESLRYGRLMGRRVRLGLADPAVANRFTLWGIGAFAAGFGTLVGTGAQLWYGQPEAQVPWVLASSSAHGLVAAIAIALAFMPPPAYVRFVQRRAARAT